jgi:hypothetical protein
MRAASEQASIYNQISSLRDFQFQSHREPEKTRQSLNVVTQRHDSEIKTLQQKYPKLANTIWQLFRRTSYVGDLDIRMALDNSKNELLLKICEQEKHQDLVIPVPITDEEKTVQYPSSADAPSYAKEIIKQSVNYRLVEFDKNYMLGIGRFAFARPNGDIFQTLWDLRQEEIQLFNYPK